MLVKSTMEFQNYVFEKLTFLPLEKGFHTLYTNPNRPELGFCHLYRQPDCYELGIADYTIPEDFSVAFHNPATQLRFGTLFHGATHFRLQNQTISSFKPSSFLVLERDLCGQQAWKRGEHFHGIEITIFENYFQNSIFPKFPELFALDSFLTNHTYHFLPMDIIHVLDRLQMLHTEEKLSPLFLEGMILECIAALANEFSEEQNCFSNQVSYGKIKIGSNRYLSVSYQDKKSLDLAHRILTEQYTVPPTIQALSEQVFLSPQKLSCMFSHFYHMTIYEYITSLRMAQAATLLCTTTLSVDDISHSVGYHHSANFIKMFKKIHGKTPLQFRRG